ncbi:MAG: hypothetical protein G01um101456_425, partial [Parcubacteria group bacterium Gr01-1014_56]
TVYVGPGEYRESVSTGGGVSLIGAGASKTTIRGPGASDDGWGGVVRLTASVLDLNRDGKFEYYFPTLSGFTITSDYVQETKIVDIASQNVNVNEVTIAYGYSKDSVYVYLNGEIIVGADPKTFLIIGTPRFTVNPEMYYAKDTLHVYFDGTILVGADPATFVLIPDVGVDVAFRSHFAKDKSHVYDSYFGTLLQGADPVSFVVLNYAYAKDTNHVYSFAPGILGDPDTVPLNGADPSTFTLVSGQTTYDAQDKDHKYLVGEIVQ